jgi:hypothetical protein
LDPQLQKEYENYFDMFATQGWKQFVEDMNDIYSSYRIEDIKTEQNLAYVKGERQMLHQVLNFEAAMRRTYDSLMERSGD